MGEETIPESDNPGGPDAVNPDNPPWGVPIAIAFWILSVLLISIIPVLTLIPYFGIGRLRGNSGEQIQDTLAKDPTAIVIALGGTFVAHLITLAFAWVIVTRRGKFGFKEVLGWRWGGFKLWHGAAIFIGVYIFFICMAVLLGTQDNEMKRILSSSRAAVFSVAIIATFSAPIVEEIVYRGVLYSAFQRALNVRLAVLVVTLIFALVHVAQYYPDAATILSILVLSLSLTLIRAKTGNIWPCIFFHFVFNGFQSLILILQPYIPVSVDPSSVQSFIRF